jgi:hypothetical protein
LKTYESQQRCEGKLGQVALAQVKHECILLDTWKGFSDHAVTSPFSGVWNSRITKSIFYRVQGNKSASNALEKTLFIDILLRGQNIAE